ncbi:MULTISPECIES: DUF2971 domain-containing protein [unclassified Clostridium]|uniref:DUF2971 domain-containing protein n=1 Tax=unclassified Clostridium TaxID=2614128 RepID=UPI00207A6D72|nr:MULTISPECIES: DUF2971 domain-containing protein [unclassified Clostridium]
MKNIKENLKKTFFQLIDNNLKRKEQLTKNYLKPYRKDLWQGYRNLKFYKYTNADYYSIRNIETGSIALKNCSEFNDIFEGIPSFKSNKDLQDSDLIRKSAAITCLCEEANNLLMFAHYANSYSGICIEYDFSLLSEKSMNILDYFFPVLYVDSPSNLEKIQELICGIESHINAINNNKLSFKKLHDIISFFIHKPSVWDYEKEWRIVVPIEQYKNIFGENYDASKKVYVLKDFDCISKIYLGKNIEPIKRDHIIEIVKRKNTERRDIASIELFETALDGSQYKLNLNKICLD